MNKILFIYQIYMCHILDVCIHVYTYVSTHMHMYIYTYIYAVTDQYSATVAAHWTDVVGEKREEISIYISKNNE